MPCSSCGAPLAAGAAFCTRCGAAVTVAENAPPSVVKTPTGVVLLAVYDFLAAAATLAFALLFVVFGGKEGNEGLRIAGGIVGLFGVLRLAAGWGMLVRAGWARLLHIVLSVPSLLNFPFGTGIAVASFVYLTRPAVKLWFAKRDTSTWSPEEVATWTRAGVGSMSGGVIAAVIGGVLLVMVPVLGIIAAIAIPNFLNAVDRGKQKRTMADIRSIAQAMEAYAADAQVYPSIGTEFVSVGELRDALVPTYITAIPAKDGWGHDVLVRSDARGYMLVSPGKDGLEDAPGFAYGPDDGGATDSFNADIVLADGKFVRYPEGAQR